MFHGFTRTLLVTLLAFVATAGIVWAATLHNVTGKLGGTTGDFFDVNGTVLVDSLRVGAQSIGGVTFFNGTIVNDTTNTSNVGNPVTFGDNVRIDGTIYRGATEGPGSDPLKLNDDVRIFGNLTVEANRTITVTNATFVGLSSDDLSDVSNIGRLNEAETLSANWVNTANPWAANEIADVTRRLQLPLNSFMTDADGTPGPLSATTQPNLIYTANQGHFLQYSEDDTVDIGTQFVVPDDYVSGGVFKAVIDTSASIVTNWDLDFKVAISQVSGTAAWDTDMDNETAVDVTNTPNQPRVLTFTPIDQADLSAGDTVFFDLFPASNTAAGEPDVEIYSLWFEYTASQ